MKIAHHLMLPEPPRPELDAVVQEARLLVARFGGELRFLYPGRRHRRWLPRRLYGLPQRAELRRLDRAVDAHQVYSNGLFDYPALAGLRRPLVYCLTTPLARRPRRRQLAAASVFVTAVERDAELLRQRGARRVELVRPGLELDRFTACGPPPPTAGGFVLMAGSAPWTARQFRTKGLLALLDAAVRRQDLRLVLLWRGALGARLRQEVGRRRLEERVEIVDRRVDVAEVLERVHAAVVLAASAKLVKPYPHSLLEALAAGRPVLASPAIELAAAVRAAGAGETVAELSAPALLTALDRLRGGYQARARAAAAFDLDGFSRRRFLQSYEAIYRDLAAAPP